MSRETAKLLAEFEALPATEKHVFVSELFRRFPPSDSGVLHDRDIDLRARGIDEVQAADLRARLKTFAEDWDRSEAAVYDEKPAAVRSSSSCFPIPTFGLQSDDLHW